MFTNVLNETVGEALPTPQTVCAVLLRATINAKNFLYTKVNQDPSGQITVLSKHPGGLAFALDAFLQIAGTLSIGNGRNFSEVASADAQDLVTLLQFRRQADESLHGQKRQSIGVQLSDKEAFKLACILAERFEEALSVNPNKEHFSPALEVLLEIAGRPSEVEAWDMPPGACVHDSGAPSADHAFMEKVVGELNIAGIGFLRDGKNSIIYAKSLLSAEDALSNASVTIAQKIVKVLAQHSSYQGPQPNNYKSTGAQFGFGS